MSDSIKVLFKNERIVNKIKSRLPYLFQVAELESSRSGKIGMEVGSTREKILIALLKYVFGEENVDSDIPITTSEEDVKLFGSSISIKTITNHKFNGVKLIWTVDAEKAKEFRMNYQPTCNVLLAQINWGSIGGLFYIPVETQIKLLKNIGREKYIKLPVPGTNPRGVEIVGSALESLTKDSDSFKIQIEWKKSEIDFDPYKRWVDYWNED
ncbi:ThaI family type II restriction endonuclease [bacterium]|nr:ThaI family type II restriction endonuclease [bacterium]